MPGIPIPESGPPPVETSAQRWSRLHDIRSEDVCFRQQRVIGGVVFDLWWVQADACAFGPYVSRREMLADLRGTREWTVASDEPLPGDQWPPPIPRGESDYNTNALGHLVPR